MYAIRSYYVGTVLQVGDGIARVYGLTSVQSNELVELESCMGVVLNLEQDNVGVVLFGSSQGVREGDLVKRTGRIASIKVGVITSYSIHYTKLYDITTNMLLNSSTTSLIVMNIVPSRTIATGNIPCCSFIF